MRNLAQSSDVVKRAKKAAQIRALLDFTNAEIADETGFTESYIRTVRQRTTRDNSPRYAPADRKFLAGNPEYWREWQQANRLDRNAYRRDRRAQRKRDKQAGARP